MDTDRTQLIDRLKQSNHVLLTVSNNPNVDQLAACIAMTLLLNKMGKHATAVYSGNTPSTLEFLKPENTIEKTTDSLRDFIIALDKSKADKLRYKVEDKLVRIFITPYKTSIGEADLEFSQGDFNVDVVLAIGIHDKEHIDNAITAHGRILHDAVVMTVNTQAGNNIGTINWVSENASSLSEMLASISDDLQPQLLDPQIATAFLTGIVAETQRFGNEKTSSSTMSISSVLMAAGADQQLVATKLEAVNEVPSYDNVAASEDEAQNNDGAIVIEHDSVEDNNIEELPDVILDGETQETSNSAPLGDIDQLTVASKITGDSNDVAADQRSDKMATDSPARVSAFTASTQPDLPNKSSVNLISETGLAVNDVIAHQDTQADSSATSGATSVADIMSSASTEVTGTADKTLEQIENEVKNQPAADEGTNSGKPDVELPSIDEVQDDTTTSTTADLPPKPQVDIENYRAAVDSAISSSPDTQRLEPISSLNAQPIDLETNTSSTTAPEIPATNSSLIDQNLSGGINPSTGLPQNSDTPQESVQDPPKEATSTDSNLPEPPPPVPPPMMPPFDSSSTSSPQ